MAKTQPVEHLRVVSELQGECFEVGRKVLSERGTCVIGMSVGNPYFDDATICELLSVCNDSFSKVFIFIADTSAAHTFEAFGYERSKAVTKARLRGNALRNKCSRVITSLGAESAGFVDWEMVVGSTCYLSELEGIRSLYEHNANFRQAARETTLETLIKKGVGDDRAISKGVHFLLEELAFLRCSNALYHTDRYAYVYHRHWPVFERLIAGEFDGAARPDIGFVMIQRGF